MARLSFGGYKNLTDVTIPNTVRVQNKDFTGKFAVPFGIDNSGNVIYTTNIKNVNIGGGVLNQIINADQMMHGMVNYTGGPIIPPSIVNMRFMFRDCYNMSGEPVCGPIVYDMLGAYQNCRNLTGSPVVGEHVYDMKFAYRGCTNLTGSPVIGPNVRHAYGAYDGCTNLTGEAVFSNLNDVDSLYANSGITYANFNRSFNSAQYVFGSSNIKNVFFNKSGSISIYDSADMFYNCDCNVFLNTNVYFYSPVNTFRTNKHINIFLSNSNFESIYLTTTNATASFNNCFENVTFFLANSLPNVPKGSKYICIDRRGIDVFTNCEFSNNSFPAKFKISNYGVLNLFKNCKLPYTIELYGSNLQCVCNNAKCISSVDIKSNNFNCYNAFANSSIISSYFSYGTTACQQAFNNCKSLNFVGLSTITGDVLAYYYSSTFQNCINLKSVYLYIQRTNNSYYFYSDNMFYNCYSLNNIDGTLMNYITISTGTFYNCSKLYCNDHIFDSSIYPYSLTYTFYNCTNFNNIICKIKNTKITNVKNMLYNCHNFTVYVYNNTDTANSFLNMDFGYSQILANIQGGQNTYYEYMLQFANGINIAFCNNASNIWN